MPDINLLLLGEPGVGKTTFINSFINYFWYENLEHAGNSTPIIAAPMTVSFLDKDNKMQFFPIDTNNDKTPIKSNPKTKEYFISCGEYQVRLIDSPGIDASKDGDQDKFRDIFRNLNHLEELHCVCFLLKASLSRMNNLFEYYIRQTLSELDETIIRNFVFIFTNGRSARFDPSAAKSVLKGFVNVIKSKPPYVEIPLSTSNVFCVENEAFVNLVAVQCGASLRSLAQVKRHSEESWDFSFKECKRLISYVLKLKPYDFPVSGAITEVQKFVVEKSYDLFTIFISNYKNLEKCSQLSKDSDEACRMVHDFKEQLKLTVGKQMLQQGNAMQKASGQQYGKGNFSKNSNYKNGRGKNKGTVYGTLSKCQARELEKFEYDYKKNAGTSGSRAGDSTMGSFEQGYAKYLDEIQYGISKMKIDDSDNKVEQLTTILKKHEKFFENIFEVVNSQKTEVHKVLRKVAEFAVFLKKYRVDDELENQAAFLLLQAREDNDLETVMIVDEMLQYYRARKYEMSKNRKEEVSAEVLQEVAKKLGLLQHYQDIIDNIFKN